MCLLTLDKTSALWAKCNGLTGNNYLENFRLRAAFPTGPFQKMEDPPHPDDI